MAFDKHPVAVKAYVLFNVIGRRAPADRHIQPVVVFDRHNAFSMSCFSSDKVRCGSFFVMYMARALAKHEAVLA